MKKLLFSLFILGGISAGAQKTINDPNAEARTVESFHALQISNAFDVVLSQSTEEGVAVSANNKDVLSHIKTVVKNGTLHIWLDDGNKWWSKNPKLRAYISVKSLNLIRASGATDINIEGGLKVPELKLDLSGASDLEGTLTVNNELSIQLSGASDVTISGSADKVTIDVNGASDIKAYEFTANTCSIEASGASSVRITADKEMSVKLSGASSLSYKGNAIIKDVKTSGSSSVSRKS